MRNKNPSLFWEKKWEVLWWNKKCRVQKIFSWLHFISFENYQGFSYSLSFKQSDIFYQTLVEDTMQNYCSFCIQKDLFWVCIIFYISNSKYVIKDFFLPKRKKIQITFFKYSTSLMIPQKGEKAKTISSIFIHHEPKHFWFDSDFTLLALNQTGWWCCFQLIAKKE